MSENWTRNLRAALVWGLCALASSWGLAEIGPARAQAPAPTSNEPAGYRRVIDEAIAEYEAGHFEEARALFARAHGLFPNARTLRGLGMAEFELRNYSESVGQLERALASRVKPLASGLRVETEQLLTRARGFIGRFALTIQPPQATVLVDRGAVQRDASGALLLAAGEHVLEISAPGFVPEQRALRVRGGEQQALNIALLEQSTATPVAVPVPVPALPPSPASPRVKQASPPEDQPAWPAPEPEIRPGPASHKLVANPSAERHDGIMLRLTLGLGAAAMKIDVAGDELTISGVSGTFSVDIGVAVFENLVLHARLSDLAMVNPSLSLNGNKLRDDGTERSVTAFLIGPGITYYVMPLNIWFAGAVGASWFSVERQGNSYRSDVGLGLNLDVGKEWWVSDQWGFGVAARLWFTQATDSGLGGDQKINCTGAAVLASVTYQ